MLSGVSEWITAREASEILGVHLSLIPKLIRRGDLSRRRKRPILNLAEVERLRVAREAQALIRAAAKEPRRSYPPDADRDWLTPDEAVSRSTPELDAAAFPAGQVPGSGVSPVILRRG
jgi:hypothetical protein